MRRFVLLLAAITVFSLVPVSPAEAETRLFVNACRESLSNDTVVFELRFQNGHYRLGTRSGAPALCDYVRFQGPITEPPTTTKTWFDQILTPAEVDNLCSGQEFGPATKGVVEIEALQDSFGVDTRIRGTSQELSIDVLELTGAAVTAGEGVFHRTGGTCSTSNPNATWKGSLVLADPPLTVDGWREVLGV